MTVSELIQFANDHRPDLIEKTANTVALVEKLHPEFLPEVLQDFEAINNVVMEKSAAAELKDIAKNVAIGVGTAIGAGLATSVATDLYDAARRGLTKGHNYKRILNENPQLKRMDKAELRKAYDSLHRYAPDFTSDPNIGGQLLFAMASEPLNNMTIIKDLLNARKNLRDIKGNQFSPMQVKMDGGGKPANTVSYQGPHLEQHFHGSRSQKGSKAVLGVSPPKKP